MVEFGNTHLLLLVIVLIVSLRKQGRPKAVVPACACSIYPIDSAIAIRVSKSKSIKSLAKFNHWGSEPPRSKLRGIGLIARGKPRGIKPVHSAAFAKCERLTFRILLTASRE